ncbi:ribosome hibernation-promoting factor, HPF/YfiA family [Marinobacterium jannaschii]|uniref:ribosome hibernation-promoting factor, HPF/YfiA family n=1 Tax=Marinobacterium jannaschii TaxID=64970 RepID=UPI0004854E24|nr:ribosome-associated translation inhibitor RaiA [Marinobacterium jannaschii]
MILNITNRNDKVSPAVRDKISDWLNSSQDRYETITRAQVTFDKAVRQDSVEATIHVAGKEVFAKANGDNLYAALDSLSEKVDKQLAKIHQKKVIKKGSKKPEEPVPADPISEMDDEDTEYELN